VQIGFDGKRATHNFRGLGNYSRSLIEGLLQYYPENQYHLFTPDFKDKRSFNWLYKNPQLIVHRPEQFLHRKIPGFWRSFSLEKLINQKEIDIYHGLSHEIPKISNHRKFKTVVTIHDLIFLRYPEFFPWLDRQVYLKKFTYAAQNADLVLAICEQTKDDIIQYLKIDEKKIKVHYQSIGSQFIYPQTEEKIKEVIEKSNIRKKFILNVGAFEERKNQLSLIESYYNLAENNEYDLILIGSGKKYFQKCRELTKKLNLESKIHFLDKVSFEDLPAFYKAASLFCFPSHFEGFGIPIVEALQSGVPVATSKGSCFPESAGPNSLFFDQNKLDDITQAMSKVLRDEKLQNLMKDEGLKYASQFNIRSTTDKLHQLYTGLI
jgi:glycosyltransferase involved in cell wall biosynthesis